MEDVQVGIFKGHCYICHTNMEIKAERISETEMQVSGGALFRMPSAWMRDNAVLCKCSTCYAQNPKFGRPTEVYSRCGGLHAPRQTVERRQTG